MFRHTLLILLASATAALCITLAFLAHSQIRLAEAERQSRLYRAKIQSYKTSLATIGEGVEAIHQLTADLAEQTSARLGVVLDLPVASFLEKSAPILDPKAQKLVGMVSLAEQRIRRRVDKLNSLPNLFPATGDISSGFGYRISPFSGLWSPHRGVDVAAPIGTPVLASAPGKVIWAKKGVSFGNLVIIDHGNDIITKYAHNSAVLVKEGQWVKRGEKIAKVGSSGRSTGPHLHYEVWIGDEAVDPRAFHGNLEFPLPWAFPLDQIGGDE